MRKTKERERLLKRISALERMERGKLCRMGARPHYNHQTWENGRNVVRYVPASETEALQEAIKGYELFRKLCEEYANEVIKQTRREREKGEKGRKKDKARKRQSKQAIKGSKPLGKN